MTELLYYTSPYRTEFESTLVSQIRLDRPEGPRWQVELQASGFYPGGGGQPADRGTLNNREVVEMIRQEDRILHILEVPLEPDTVSVFGRIEPMHRRHFMQQHTGQHILSAVLHGMGRNTRSIHLGEEISTIEVDGSPLSAFEIVQLEDQANRIICSNLAVRGFISSLEELDTAELRRSLKASGRIRIVEIEHTDKVGCGGVHLARTGEVRLIKHTASETVRGNSRLSFVIGDAALADYREKSRISARLTELLSKPQHELLQGLEEQQEKISRGESRVIALLKQLNRAVAGSLIGSSEVRSDGRLVAAQLEQDQADQLREIAEALTAGAEPVFAALVAPAATGVRWIISLPEAHAGLFDTLREELLPLIGGRGGGRVPFWQGAGTRESGSREFLEVFKERIRSI